MSIRIATLTIDELQVGKEEAFEQAIVEADIDDFAKVSGDISPVHMDAAFARTCGFKGRVVHGGLLTALVSRLIGVYLPGRNCLWQSCQIGFVAPAYAGMTVRVAGVVNQVSVAVQYLGHSDFAAIGTWQSYSWLFEGSR